jgi:hypothetical protein
MKFHAPRIVPGILAALLSAAAAPSARAESAVIDGVEWEYSLDGSGNATVTDGPTEGDLVIPAELDGHPVIAIGARAFRWDDITSVTFPDSVETIGDYAFEHCFYLASVTFASGLVSIGKEAFYTCSLTSLDLPDSVKSLGDSAFCHCSGLASVSIGAGVADIGKNAFWDCPALERFEVAPANAAFASPGGVLFTKDGKTLLLFPPAKGVTAYEVPSGTKTIATGAFSACSNLVSVAFPDGLEDIGEGAFSGCQNLSSAPFPDGLRNIGDSAFQDCTTLVSLSIPGSVTNIGDKAFWGCNALASLTIKDGAASSIGAYAFSLCEELATVSLGSGVAAIGYYAFEDCSALATFRFGRGVSAISPVAFDRCEALASFEMDEANAAFSVRDGVVFSKDGKTLCVFPWGRSGTYAVPEGTETIVPSVFEDNALLESVTLPESVASVGEYAFDGCDLLTLHVPASWEGTDMLDAANVPEKCVLVYGEVDWNWEWMVAEDGCVTLTGGGAGQKAIPIPSEIEGRRVTEIGWGAFSMRAELERVVVPGSVTNIQITAFDNCPALQTLRLCKGLRDLGDSAFQGCTNLLVVTLPRSLERIGTAAFADCTALLGVGFSFSEDDEQLREIGDGAFQNCANLADVDWPENLEAIGALAFARSGLQTAYLPDSVRTLGAEAFGGCEQLEYADIPGGVEELPENLFKGCTNLYRVELNDGLRRIGGGVFVDCSALESLEIPDGVESVGLIAFYDSGLKALSVPGEWHGTGKLDEAALPEGCVVTYRGIEPVDPRYGDWAAGYGLTEADLPPDGDYDGDGIGNYGEFVAGTDPLNVFDYLRVWIVSDGGNVEIWSDPAQPAGRVYTYQGTADLTAGESGWTDLTDADRENLPATPYRSFRVKAEYPEETP